MQSSSDPAEAQNKMMAGAVGILVVAETADGRPIPAAYEVLGLAQRLREDMGGLVAAVALGSGVGAASQDLVAHGADQVWIGDDPVFADCQADALVPTIANLAREISPRAILAAHTTAGADLAPRLAFKLQTGVATACIAAEVVDGRLLLTRPCYGGNAREVLSIRTVPAVATIKAKTQDVAIRDETRSGMVAVIAYDPAAAPIRTRIRDRWKESDRGAALEKAAIVISGGRGLNGPEGFKLAESLAKLLGGAVGASRAACDLGWCPPYYQIGLSGRTVAPELYLALGISGAGQHMAGCAGAKTIVAINSDADAAIFGFSRFGVVGDCRQILPALIAEIERLKA